jgi:hypothetical protein
VSHHLSRFEPAHIHWVVEHMLHDCELLPHPDGVSRENDLLSETVQDRKRELVRYFQIQKNSKIYNSLSYENIADTFFNMILSGSTPPKLPVPTRVILYSSSIPRERPPSGRGSGVRLKTRTGLGWKVIGA